jgi:aminoglycoside phosphotransferase (APT) family kinase protein
MAVPSQLIEQRFGQRLGTAVSLVERRLASEGLSDETAILTFADDGNQETRVVVRLFRAGAIARHEVDPERLHRLLVALAATDLPVPRPLWFDPSSDLFGSPYSVVSWVPGKAVVPWSKEGRAMLAGAGTGPIGAQFPALLADIHTLDWRAAGLDFLPVPEGETGFPAGCVEEIAAYLNRVGDEPEPILTDAVGWLRSNLPSPARTCLLHGDYRTGNMLFEEGRISAILDWEFARIGDPIFDLGWVCAPSNRVGSDLVCMVLPEKEFLVRYEESSGYAVEPHALRFWILFHQVRHAAMWIDAGRRFASGDTDDLRLARMHYTAPRMREMVAHVMESL